MVNRSTLDPDQLPGQTERKTYKGQDTRSLGPSDSSDSGSDLAGASLSDSDLGDTSGSEGTGERLTVGQEPDIRVGNDIAPDRIVGADEAGLGGGLDQAEEARLGITDEDCRFRSKHPEQK